MPENRSLLVAAATYRRPDDLERCLRTVRADIGRFHASHPGWNVGILIVDNDPDGGARELCAQLSGPDLTYVHEPEPGISAARNRALDESAAHDLLVFIDDDEEPEAGWLGLLVDTYESSRASAVAGRVVSAFPGPLDPWIEAGGFFRRRSLPTGTPIQVAATNNLLLDLAVLRRLELRFDPRYGLTGGGDTDFTRRLVKGGGTMVWCDEAVVVDHVPADRATRAWVTRRARRTGSMEVSVGLDLAESAPERARVRLKGAALGSVRVVGGAVRSTGGRMTGSQSLSARGAKAMSRGRGMLAGSVGRRIGEYHRPAVGSTPGPAPTPSAPDAPTEPSSEGNRPVRVLASFPQPRPTTNPYIVQLARALDAEPGVELIYFSWRSALCGRYDVVHIHWPEVLLAGASTAKTWLRRGAFTALLVRWTVARTPVVRTLHNEAPHEPPAAPDRFLLRRLDRRVRASISIDPAAVEGPGSPVILHGHYLDWFESHPRSAPVPGRIAFAGLVREYKNVEGLVAAFQGVEDQNASLRVVGRPQPPALGERLRRMAADDPRIAFDLRYLADADLVAEVTAAQLVVLPYRRGLNSGAALMALSLGRPVLMADTEGNRALASEVGEAWVRLFSAPLTAQHLQDALATCAAPEETVPDLQRRSWQTAGSSHAQVYRSVAGRSRR